MESPRKISLSNVNNSSRSSSSSSEQKDTDVSKYFNLAEGKDRDKSESLSLQDGDRSKVSLLIDCRNEDVAIDKIKSNISSLLKAGLHDHAENNCYVQRLFIQNTPLHNDQLHIRDSYVNLSIIKNPDDKNKKEKAKDLQVAYQNERQQNYESLYKKSTPIEIDNLFDDSEHRRQLIIGAPGVGKTTLCQHLFYCCNSGDENNRLWSDKFELVFWIPLRELKSGTPPKNKAKLLAFVACNYGLSGNIQDSIGSNINKLGGFITDNHEKILWILDGYDEVITEANQESSLVYNFLKKLNSYGKEGPAIIITSRPQTQYSIGSSSLVFDRVLENIGFTDENVDGYVKKFFKSGSVDTEECLKLLKQNPAMYSSVHIPIILEIMCSIWSSTPKEEIDKIHAIPKLYKLMVDNLWLRYLQKYVSKESELGDVPDKTKYISNDLCSLAALGFEKNEVILSYSTLNEIYQINKHKYNNIDFSVWCKQLKHSGFMRSIKGNNPQEIQYYFIHLSFQEYFAGLHYAQQFISKSNEVKVFLQETQYSMSHRLMWQFTIGHLYQHYETTNDAIPLLSYWEVVLCPIDMTGENYLSLVMDGLEACGVDRSIPIHENLFQDVCSLLFVTRYNNLLRTRMNLLKSCFLNISTELTHEQLDAFIDDTYYLNNGFTTLALSSSSFMIESLIKQLNNEKIDSNFKSRICDFLIYITKNGDQVVIDALISRLDDLDQSVRVSAVRSLGIIAEKGNQKVIDAFMSNLGTDKNITYFILIFLENILVTINEKITEILLKLLDDNCNEEKYICKILVKFAQNDDKYKINLIDSLIMKFGTSKQYLHLYNKCDVVAALADASNIDYIINNLINSENHEDGFRLCVYYTLAKLVHKEIYVKSNKIINEVISYFKNQFSNDKLPQNLIIYEALYRLSEQKDKLEIMDNLIELVKTNDNDYQISKTLVNLIEVNNRQHVINKLIMVIKEDDVYDTTIKQICRILIKIVDTRDKGLAKKFVILINNKRDYLKKYLYLILIHVSEHIDSNLINILFNDIKYENKNDYSDFMEEFGDTYFKLYEKVNLDGVTGLLKLYDKYKKNINLLLTYNSFILEKIQNYSRYKNNFVDDFMCSLLYRISQFLIILADIGNQAVHENKDVYNFMLSLSSHKGLVIQSHAYDFFAIKYKKELNQFSTKSLIEFRVNNLLPTIKNMNEGACYEYRELRNLKIAMWQMLKQNFDKLNDYFLEKSIDMFEAGILNAVVYKDKITFVYANEKLTINKDIDDLRYNKWYLKIKEFASRPQNISLVNKIFEIGYNPALSSLPHVLPDLLKQDISDNNQAQLKQILKQFPHYLHTCDTNGSTLLHLVARHNFKLRYTYEIKDNFEMVKLLIDMGVNINVFDNKGNSPLFIIINLINKIHEQMNEVDLDRQLLNSTSDLISNITTTKTITTTTTTTIVTDHDTHPAREEKRLNLNLELLQEMAGYLITHAKLDAGSLERLLSNLYLCNGSNLIDQMIIQWLGYPKLATYYKDQALINIYCMDLYNLSEVRNDIGHLLKSSGNDKRLFICFRIKVYIEILLKLLKLDSSSALLVNLPRNLDLNQTIVKLKQEILINAQLWFNIQIYDDYNYEKNDNDTKKHLKHCHIDLIINDLKGLEEGSEYYLQSGYYNTDTLTGAHQSGHCIYVAFCKLKNNQILVRVDNRTIGVNDKKHVTSRIKQIKFIENELNGRNVDQIETIYPYCVGVISLDSDLDNLKEYISVVISSFDLDKETCMENLYDVRSNKQLFVMPENSLLIEVMKNWPSQERQRNAQNCTMSSHNFGVLCRHGKEFAKWLIKEEISIMLPRFSSTSRDFQFPTNLVVKLLFNLVGIRDNEIQDCRDVQCVLGSDTSILKLKFSSFEQQEKFIRAYNAKLPQFIQSKVNKYKENELTELVVNTKILLGIISKATGIEISANISTSRNTASTSEPNNGNGECVIC